MNLTISDEGLENIPLLPEIREKAIKKAKEGYVMALLEVGEISSGKAAEILGVSRLEMIEIMNKWGISIFDDSQDLEGLRQEVERAELTLNRHKKKTLLEAFANLDDIIDFNVEYLGTSGELNDDSVGVFDEQ